VTKGKLGRIWTHWRMGQGTWWQRIWKRLRSGMPSSYQSSLARPVFRNPRCRRLDRKAGECLVEEDQVREYLSKLNVS